MCCADASCAAPETKPKRGRDVRDAARDERALRSFSRETRRDELEQRDERDEIRRPFFLYDASSKTKTHGALGDAVVLEDVGACSEHASRRKCGGGSCCFLLLKSTRVLILHSSGTRACLFPSPYVDAHGEEDERPAPRAARWDMSPWTRRARLLETLWASGALEHDSRATGAQQARRRGGVTVLRGGRAGARRRLALRAPKPRGARYAFVLRALLETTFRCKAARTNATLRALARPLTSKPPTRDVPRAVVRARPLEHLEVAAPRRDSTGIRSRAPTSASQVADNAAFSPTGSREGLRTSRWPRQKRTSSRPTGSRLRAPTAVYRDGRPRERARTSSPTAAEPRAHFSTSR